jgi:23S rRNA (pseudouridine1915-N3)-methyltransferase
MHIRILIAGKPSLAYAKSGTEEYLKRLQRIGDHKLEIVKAGASAEVSARLLDRSAGSFRIALDERGALLSTSELAKCMDDIERREGVKEITYLIGAADGHTEELRKSSDLVLSLSPLTLQHELALVVLLEQIYRVATLRRGEPYHRE